MPIAFDQLAVSHIDRDEKGVPLEPEEQSVQQIGSMPVHVNMGTANFAEGRGPPIATQRNVGTLRHLGAIRRTTSAFEAEKQARMRCDNCKEFDLEAGQKHLAGDPNDRHRIASLLVQYKGRVPQEAEAEVRVWGKCRHKNAMTGPYNNCERFTVHSRFKKVLSQFHDLIMRSAGGKTGGKGNW